MKQRRPVCLGWGGYLEQPVCYLRTGGWIELLSKPPFYQHLCQRWFPASPPRKVTYLFTSEIWSRHSQTADAVLCPQLCFLLLHSREAQRSLSPQQPWWWWRQACQDREARGREVSLNGRKTPTFRPQLTRGDEKYQCRTILLHNKISSCLLHLHWVDTDTARPEVKRASCSLSLPGSCRFLHFSLYTHTVSSLHPELPSSYAFA